MFQSFTVILTLAAIFSYIVIHLLHFKSAFLILGLLAILIVLIARIISVSLPFSLLKHPEHHTFSTIAVLSWGGLRGGISVALVLSLDEALSKDVLLFVTYTVVLFSIIVQGLSLRKVVKVLKMGKAS